ncbi:MAG TPA: TatD family hydrolase [Candidatus Cybelea sp.]
MIDTHCHVHDRAFDADRDEVIARAREAGVRAMVTIGESLDDSAAAVDTARRYGLCAAVGIHPHEAAKAPADIETRLKPLLAQAGVVALGEIGLDYYYDHSPRDAQAEVFKEQLRIGREAGVPIVFHQRDAFEDFSAVLRLQWRSGMRGVVHCFTGSPAQARTYVDEFGLFLGIGGVLTFPKAQAVRDAVCEVGLRAIVLETDCPYLAPVPKRGKRNEPAYVTYTAGKLAELLNVPLAEVVARTDANAATLFGI